MGKIVRGSFTGIWRGESTELGMSFCSPKTRFVLIGTRGRHRNGWKETEYGSHMEEIDEHVDTDEPSSFLDHVY